MSTSIFDVPYIPLYHAEQNARVFRRFHALDMPGPAQCEELTLALYEAAQQDAAGTSRELPWSALDAVARQNRRRQALLSNTMRSTTILLYEHLFARIHAMHASAVARAQVAFLRGAVAGATDATDWCDDRTTVRILPQRCACRVPSDFTIVLFADGPADDFVYSEDSWALHGAGDPRYRTDPDSLSDAAARWKRLLAEAVNEGDTLHVLNDLDARLR